MQFSEIFRSNCIEFHTNMCYAFLKADLGVKKCIEKLCSTWLNGKIVLTVNH